jgi:hypothetical protein
MKNLKSIPKNKGAALIMFIMALVFSGMSAILYFLNQNNFKSQRFSQTYASLSQAKEALIGYAVLNASKPGTLPCPDTDNNGNSNFTTANCTSYIGRLPWRLQLGTHMLKDSTGECLWYALSPVFRTQMTDATRVLDPLNSTTNGTINIVNDLDVPVASVNPVLAVVFAPNYPVTGQNRSGATTVYCPGDSVASKYLDTKGLVNNSTGNVVGANYTFKIGAVENGFNDQLIYITARDLYPTLRKRITKEIVGNSSPIAVPIGLVEYYQNSATYPCPASTVFGNQNCALVTGFVPYNDAAVNLQYTALGSWLEDNGWFAMTTYNYITSQHVSITVTDPLGSYTCDANMNVITCS